MEKGCSSLDRSFLITLTLKLGAKETHPASFVKVAWTRHIRRLKLRSPNLTWFRVIEATKKGTPHLHLLVGNLGKERIANSHGKKPPYSKAFIKEDCKRDCLLHEWGRSWFEETGAYVVDVEEVYSAPGAARYLAKYLVKGFVDRTRLLDLGYHRRYSMARNWPRGEALRLRGTVDGVWESVEIIPRWFQQEKMQNAVKLGEGASVLESVGDDVTLAMAARVRRRTKLRDIERLGDALLPSSTAT